MLKRSPKNTKRLTRRDLDALAAVAAPTVNKATTLRQAEKLEAFGLVEVHVVRAPGAARATSWTASLTTKGQALLDTLR